MASAHYFFRNYDIKQVLNLLCYMSDNPSTLTSTQKITRMYRYQTSYVDASFEEKNNGLMARTGVILLTITVE